MTESASDSSNTNEPDVSVDPPVVIEGKGLAVECASCGRRNGVPTEIDGRGGEATGDDWNITFTVDDGALVVQEAYCPEHRIGDAIDDLAEKQAEFATEFAKTCKQTDEMVSS